MNDIPYSQMTPGQKAAYTKRMRATQAVMPTEWKQAKGFASAPGLTEIESLAIAKMAEHGLTEKGWRFMWDKAPLRGGCCKFKMISSYVDGKYSRTVAGGTISLSKPIFSKPENQAQALDTILHEIAHALAGPKHGHDWHWKQVARSIGCTAQRCHTMDTPTSKYVADCPCGSDHGRMFLPKRSGYRCRKTRHELTWRLRNP